MEDVPQHATKERSCEGNSISERDSGTCETCHLIVACQQWRQCDTKCKDQRRTSSEQCCPHGFQRSRCEYPRGDRRDAYGTRYYERPASPCDLLRHECNSQADW